MAVWNAPVQFKGQSFIFLTQATLTVTLTVLCTLVKAENGHSKRFDLKEYSKIIYMLYTNKLQ